MIFRRTKRRTEITVETQRITIIRKSIVPIDRNGPEASRPANSRTEMIETNLPHRSGPTNAGSREEKDENFEPDLRVDFRGETTNPTTKETAAT